MTANEARRTRVRRLTGPGPALAVVYFVLLVMRNASRLGHPIRDAADFAANSMLMDRAQHFQQLTGNYSRVHFHHPGPFFLYVGAAGQWVFHQLLHVVPADFNGQLIAFFLLNAALAGLVVTELNRHVPSAAACIAGVTVVLLWLGQHVALSVPWPPYLYVLPFLLLAVTAPSVVVGELASLPAYVLAAGMLVHGHASFLMFVGVTTTVVLACWWVVQRDRRAELLREFRRPILVSAAILGVFLLPMVADLVLHWPGQWQLYWDYSQAALSNPLGKVATYVGQFWTTVVLGWLGFAAALLASAGLTLRRPYEERRYLTWLGAFVALLVGLVGVYAYRGVDDLTQLYTGDFSTVLPGLVLGVAALLVVQAVSDLVVSASAAQVRAAGAVLAVGSAALVLLGTGMAVHVATYAAVDADLDHLVSLARPGQMILLEFPHADASWPKALAVLEEAHRRHLPVCLPDRSWAFIVSPDFECTPEQAATGLVVNAVYVGPKVKRLTTVTWSGGHLAYSL